MRRIVLPFCVAATVSLVCWAWPALAADAQPAPTAGVSIAIDSTPDAQGKVSVTTNNPTSATQSLDLELRVVDFFQKPVFSMQKRLQVAPGEHSVDLATFPARDAKRFRADLRYRYSSGKWQESVQYADVDYVASGPRRIQRIDSGPWQRLVPAESPPGPPPYPPQGQWEPTKFPLKPAWSETSHWTWFRQEIVPQQWLVGKQMELRFAQVDYNCHVYMNGQKVAEHMVAATPFSVDITKYWKPDQLNVLEIAVGDMTTTYADFSKGMMYNLLTPSFGSGGAPGIWEGVWLMAHSPVYIEDVFVMPSVKHKELRIRTWVRNATMHVTRITLNHIVEDEGHRALSVAPKIVRLRPGEHRMVEVAQAWDNPKLWWPHSPHLYRLRTRLYADGKCLDEVSTRFGFREVSIDGINLLLNGRIFRPFGVNSAGEGRGIRRPSREMLNFWAQRRKVDEPWLMRLHVQVRPGWYAEVADEMGVCLEPESHFCSTVYYQMASRTFWRNTIQHVQELVTRDRNSPSVIYWSAGNEVILAAGASKTSAEHNMANMKRVIAAIKKVDPTRPVVSEGGLDETAEVVDLHYPRSWYNNVDFPNCTYWLKPGVMTESFGGQTPMFTWKGDRPFTVGEEGQLFTTQPPFDMAVFIGDSAYLENFGYGTSARFRAVDDMVGAGYIEGYRRSGVVRIAPDLGASGGPQMNAAMKRVRTFISPRDECFLSGATIKRDVTVFHDVLVREVLKLTWRVVAYPSVDANTTAEGKPLAGGTEQVQMAAGEVRHLPIEWEAPTVEKPVRLVLAVELSNDQGRVFLEKHDYFVYPREPLHLPDGALVGLYDPAGLTEEALRELGVTGLKKIDSLAPASLVGLSALIIGENVPSEQAGAKEALAALVQAGGKIIMLRSGQVGLKWAPLAGLSCTKGIEHTYCFVRDRYHPLVAGIDDRLLRLWGTDHVVSQDTLAKVTSHNAVPIIDAGGPYASGLSYAPLTEIAMPRGSWVLCQLLVIEKADKHPGARRLLQNILDYAAAPPQRAVGPVGVLAGADSVVRRLLDDLGFVTRDVSTGGLDQVRTVVVDAESIAGRGRALRQFAEQGGNVLVKGLTPDSLERFDGLFPAPPDLVADDRTKRPVQDAPDPLTSGISNEELYWERRTRQFAFGPEHYTGTLVYNYLIKLGPGMKGLYRTELRDYQDDVVESRGAGLVKIPVGHGCIVIDQTRWGVAYEPQPQVWGSKVRFADGLKRYVSLLLTNLGAQAQ